MMGGMKRLLAVAAILAASIFAGAPAQADPQPGGDIPIAETGYSGEHVRNYEAWYDVHADGTTDVVIEMAYDFAGQYRRGPYLSYPIRVPYDKSNDRFFPISNIRAESPSGAYAKVNLDKGKSWLDVRIGDADHPDTLYVETYRISFTVDGLLNGIDESDFGEVTGDPKPLWDEFYVNVIGDSWTVPLANVTIHVTGDSPILPVSQDDAGVLSTGADAAGEGVYCTTGDYGSVQSCDSAITDGTTATFTQDWVPAYESMTVLAAFPPGSVDTTPIIRTKNDVAYALRITPVTGGAAGAVLVGGVLLLSRKIRGSAVDEQYAGMTPGLGPTDISAARIVKRDYHAPVAVQFEPPPGFRPGQLGTLMDERADVRDVTATIVDLAVRGYLRIEEVGDKKKKPDYELVKLRDADDGLFAYEKKLHKEIFSAGDRINMKDDLQTKFASDLAAVQSKMYENVVDLGWFRANPKTTRTAWAGAGVFVLLAGIGLGVLLGKIGPWAFIAVPVVLIGIMILFTVKNAPARTAEGTKVLMQAQGFQTFLETADGNKLRYEEGLDIFSKFLPYAIAFGVADKWTAVFEKLAAKGAALPNPTWYSGSNPLFWANIGSFNSRLSSFASVADRAMSTPTPGSSGSSGFSGGGGGFSGGGSFGGGGGSW